MFIIYMPSMHSLSSSTWFSPLRDIFPSLFFLAAPYLRACFLQLPSMLPSSSIEVGHVSILYSIKLASIPAPNNEKRTPALPSLSLLGSPTLLICLRRSASPRSRRVPERRRVHSRKALHVFTLPNVSFLSLSLSLSHSRSSFHLLARVA